MKRIKEFYLNVWLKYVGACVHELFHILMILILYPFGAKLVGLNIKIGNFCKEGEEEVGCVSFQSQNRIIKILIGLAPLIFFFFFYTVMIVLGLWVPSVIFYSLYFSMLPSPSDIACLKKLPSKELTIAAKE